MKKLFAIITVLFVAAGIASAQDNGKKASTTTTTQAAPMTKCDMRNFYCMRAGRMTCIKDGQEVGLAADVTLKGGVQMKTNGTYTDAKGKSVVFNEGDAIDFNGNRCTLVDAAPATTVPAPVK